MLRRLATSLSGEVTLDMGPGSEICTPAPGMGGVGVMVGVRVARRVGVALKSTVLVALGAGLRVEEGLNASEVGLGPVVGVSSGVGVGGEVWVASTTTTGEGVTEGARPSLTGGESR